MENICIDHMANQEHFLRIDARLGEHDQKINEQTKMIERQIALSEGQQCTNERLERNIEKQDERILEML